jgi:hypothetical protein
VANASTAVAVDLIDEITVIVGPILVVMTGIDVIIAVTTAAMTDAMTVVVMIATTGMTTDAIIDVARTTTITTTTIGRNKLHHHRPKGATLMACFRRPTARSTSSSEVAKRSKVTGRPDRMPGRSGMSTLRTRDLCVGLNS